MRSLLTPDGWALLESLPPYDEQLAIPLGERLRSEGHDPATVAAALTQSRLRAKAHDKLGPFADAMLFTPDGLEQATRLAVAAHHARRYVGAGVQRVADLGCGLGSDAMAFAGLDRAVLAIDADELTAAFATVNLRHWPDAEVRCHDVMTLDLEGMLEPGDGVWLDPARRTHRPGRRLAAHLRPGGVLAAVLVRAGRRAPVPGDRRQARPGHRPPPAAGRRRGAVGVGARGRRRVRAVVRAAGPRGRAAQRARAGRARFGARGARGRRRAGARRRSGRSARSCTSRTAR